MSKVVTIKDIANSLGLSRNTVSKALNNQHVAKDTKKLIIDKAIELGYKGFTNYEKKRVTLNLLILSGKSLYDLDFFISFIRGVEGAKTNYNLEIFQYTYNTTSSFDKLKNHIDALKIDGIIGIELYNKELLDSILSTKLPVVFVDASMHLKNLEGNYDVLLMNSRDNIYKLSNKLIEQGYTRLTFCGDRFHCIGFNERYLGMRDSLDDINHRIDMSQQLLLDDSSPFGDISWMTKKIKALKYLPHAIICANDSIAASVIKALKVLNYKIPEDIQVIGFDNTVDSTLSTRTITTVDVNKEILGKEAIYLLIDKMFKDDKFSKIVYINTEIVHRESTSI